MFGKVVRKKDDKGYGFIQNEAGQEFFFHLSGLKNIRFEELEVGTPVSFEYTEGEKGLRADQIVVQN